MQKKQSFSLLLIPLIGFVTGIYCYASYRPLLWQAVGLSTVSCIMLVYASYQRYRQMVYSALFLLFVASGILVNQAHDYYYQQVIATITNTRMTITGSIVDKQSWGDYNNHVLRIRISSCSTLSWLWFECCIQCYFMKKIDYQVGDYIVIEDIIIKQPASSPDQSPSYTTYLCKEGLCGSLFLSNHDSCTLLHRPGLSIARMIWHWRQETYKQLMKQLAPLTRRYVGLIFFGNKQQRSINSLRNTFNFWGISHYLARSGLHISLLIMLWTLLLQCIPLPLLLKRSLLVILCFLYELLSWSSIPFLRAFYIFVLMYIGWLLKRQAHYLHLLTFVCLLLLLFNPLYAYFLDFQLTFLLTFAVLIVAPVLSHNPKTN